MLERTNYKNPSRHFSPAKPLTEEELKQGYKYPTIVNYYYPEENKPESSSFQEFRLYPEPDWEKYERLRQKEPVTLPEDFIFKLINTTEIRDTTCFAFW